MGQSDQPASLGAVLPRARFDPYLLEAGSDMNRAEELYRWNARLSGAWHVHLSYIEICLRHTMDQQLREWNTHQVGPDGSQLTSDWTAAGGTGELLYTLIGKGLSAARTAADKDAKRRPFGHPRYRQPPTQDDVVSQLVFGAWSRLLLLPGKRSPNDNNKKLWRESLSRAFPNVSPTADGLTWVGNQVESLRKLRNRTAHHENLLSLDTRARLNGSLALLRMIDNDLPDIVMRSSQLRSVASEDPRKNW